MSQQNVNKFSSIQGGTNELSYPSLQEQPQASQQYGVYKPAQQNLLQKQPPHQAQQQNQAFQDLQQQLQAQQKDRVYQDQQQSLLTQKQTNASQQYGVYNPLQQNYQTGPQLGAQHQNQDCQGQQLSGLTQEQLQTDNYHQAYKPLQQNLQPEQQLQVLQLTQTPLYMQKQTQATVQNQQQQDQKQSLPIQEQTQATQLFGAYQPTQQNLQPEQQPQMQLETHQDPQYTLPAQQNQAYNDSQYNLPEQHHSNATHQKGLFQPEATFQITTRPEHLRHSPEAMEHGLRTGHNPSNNRVNEQKQHYQDALQNIQSQPRTQSQKYAQQSQFPRQDHPAQQQPHAMQQGQTYQSPQYILPEQQHQSHATQQNLTYQEPQYNVQSRPRTQSQQYDQQSMLPQQDLQAQPYPQYSHQNQQSQEHQTLQQNQVPYQQPQAQQLHHQIQLPQQAYPPQNHLQQPYHEVAYSAFQPYLQPSQQYNPIGTGSIPVYQPIQVQFNQQSPQAPLPRQGEFTEQTPMTLIKQALINRAYSEGCPQEKAVEFSQKNCAQAERNLAKKRDIIAHLNSVPEYRTPEQIEAKRAKAQAQQNQPVKPQVIQQKPQFAAQSNAQDGQPIQNAPTYDQYGRLIYQPSNRQNIDQFSQEIKFDQYGRVINTSQSNKYVGHHHAQQMQPQVLGHEINSQQNPCHIPAQEPHGAQLNAQNGQPIQNAQQYDQYGRPISVHDPAQVPHGAILRPGFDQYGRPLPPSEHVAQNPSVQPLIPAQPEHQDQQSDSVEPLIEFNQLKNETKQAIASCLQVDMEDSTIAENLNVSTACINLVRQEIEGSKPPDQINEKIRDSYFKKHLTALEITRLVPLTLEEIQAVIDEALNTGNTPIAEVKDYMPKDQENHRTYLLNFQKVSYSLTKTGEIEKQCTDQSLTPLYSGQCICDVRCSRVVNLLVMGQTGAGKTTLVDSLCNYLLDIKYFDNFRYKLVDEKALIEERVARQSVAQTEVEKNKAAQVHSMTSTVTIYHLPARKIVNHPYKSACCINVIDTPGFADTRGPEWDMKISLLIKELLQNITVLDYIMITVKASETRLDPRMKMVYSQIQNLYAKDMVPRLLGMYTFADDDEPSAIAAIQKADMKLYQYFKFNNSSMFKHPECNGAQFIQLQFESCMNNHAQFIKFIREKDAIPVSLGLSRQVLESRKSIETHGQAAKKKAQVLSMNLFEIGNKIKEVRKNVKFLNLAKDNVMLSAGKRSELMEKQVQHRVIRCNACEQDEMCICHNLCECGSQCGDCKVFKYDTRCTECQHDLDQHVVSDTVFEIGHVMDEVDLEDLKNSYDKSMHLLENDKHLIFKYINELEDIVNQLEEQQLQIKECDDFLMENAARKQSHFELNYYQEQITRLEKDKRDNWQGQVQMLQHMMNQQKAIRDAVQHKLIKENLNLKTNAESEEQILKRAELTTILNYWKGFKDQFKHFQEQIKSGNFKKVDEWCAALEGGQSALMSLDGDKLKEMQNPYHPGTRDRIKTVARDLKTDIKTWLKKITTKKKKVGAKETIPQYWKKVKNKSTCLIQ